MPTNAARSATSASISARDRPSRGVGGEPVEQVVGRGRLLPHGQGDRDRVLLDRLVRRLPADARAGPPPPGSWWWPGTAGSGRARGRPPPGRRRTRRAPSARSGTARRWRRTRPAGPPAAPPSRRRRPRSTDRRRARRPSTGSPGRTTASPLTRSHERVFILCGMADEPTWPAWKPSVTSSCPAISRIVVASDDGPATAWASAETHVEVERARIHLADAGQHPGEAEVPRRPPAPARPPWPRRRSRSSWSGGRADRALDAAQRDSARCRSSSRSYAMSSSSAAVANRLPSVVAWAGTLCDRPDHHQLVELHRARRPAGPAWPPCGRGPAPARPGSAAARRSRSGRARSFPCGCARARPARRTPRCAPSRRAG